jgi:hypothetical protein
MQRLSASLQHELWFLWWTIAHENQADLEADFIDPKIRNLFDDEESVRAAVHNWRIWRAKAKKDFDSVAGAFLTISIVSTGRPAAHFPAVRDTTQTIRHRTVNSDSVFFSTWPVTRLEPLLFDALAARFEDLQGLHHARIGTCVDTVVGASDGLDTNCLTFDVDLSTPQAHAFPVLPLEARKEQFFVPPSELAGLTY